MKDTLTEIGKVWAVNTATAAVVTLAHVQTIVAITLGLTSIAYTIHKWKKDNEE